MDSCFAELPDHVLSSCLRLTSFVAKLRCQQVCASWRSLLERSAAPGNTCETSNTSLWGLSLNLYVSEPTETLARTPIEYLGYITCVNLITTAGPLSLHSEACLHWIAQQAMVFPQVYIHIDDIRAVSPAQLMPRLATALIATTALAPPGWLLQLDAGKKPRATKLHLRRADKAISLQVSSKLVKCPDSYSTALCRFRRHRSSIWLSTACRGAQILESKRSKYTATFLSDTTDSSVLYC